MRKTIALLGLPLLAACAGPKADLPLICIAEVNPPGSYTYPAGIAAPTVSPDTDGTAAGAAAVNACIRSKAAAGQGGGMMKPIAESSAAPKGVPTQSSAPAPRYTEKQRGASVLSGGAGYHGAVMEGGTGYAGAQSAAPATKRKKAPRGKMALPSGYALMPGDEALWYSLTLAQQQRALEFLEDGSTIRSSLEAD
ncbi:MAG: hypothetical protein ACRCS0_06885 [Albidovulum sp.]